MKTKKIPYVCPVCQGKGVVSVTRGVKSTVRNTVTISSDSTSSQLNEEICKACKGACIVWGEETDDTIDFSKLFPPSQPSYTYPIPYPYPPDQPYRPWINPDTPWCNPNITWCNRDQIKGKASDCLFPNFGVLNG